MCQRRLRGEPGNQLLLLLLLAGLLLFSSPSPPGYSGILPGCDARLLLPLEQLESWGYGGTGENFHGNGGDGEEGISSHRILAESSLKKAPAAPAKHAPAPAPRDAPAPHDAPAPAPHTLSPESVTSIETSGSGKSSSLLWTFLIGPAVFLVLLGVVGAVVLRFVVKRRRRRVGSSLWMKGLSFQETQQLQQYNFAGVPTISFEELEAACEEFTNVIGTSTDCVIFKGTRISDGLQIAVTRMKIPPEQWTARREIGFRHKVEDLARMSHENLVNLVAYCATDTPFERMLVFEYASNGTLYEHLHARHEADDNLEWASRMRIVMGAACGLEYLHHKLVPPTSHFKFDARHVFLTEDYAAKLADFAISADSMQLEKSSLGRRRSFRKIATSVGYNDWEMTRQTPNLESNIRSFGIFLLEVITGRLPFTDTQGPLVEWAKDYLNDPERMRFLVDPSLKAHKKSELVAICEVIRTCVRPKASKLPTMNELADQLSKALKMPREMATRKNSPLLWAEMELLASMDRSLSMEAPSEEFPLGKALPSPKPKSPGALDSGKLSSFSLKDPITSTTATKGLSRNVSGDNEQQRGMPALPSPLPRLATKMLSSGGLTSHSSNRDWAADAAELELLSPNDVDSGSGEDQEAPLAASINSSLPRDQESFGRSFRRVWVENSNEVSRFDDHSPRRGRSSDNLGR